MSKKVITQVLLRTLLARHGHDVSALSPVERWNVIQDLWMRGVITRTMPARPHDKHAIEVDKGGVRAYYAWAQISRAINAQEKPVEKPEMKVIISSVLRRPEYGQLLKEAMRKAKNVHRLHYHTNGPRSALKAAQGIIDKYTQMAWDQSGRPFDGEVLNGHTEDRTAPAYAATFEWMPYRAMEERRERNARRRKRRY